MALDHFGGFETGDFADITTFTGAPSIVTTQKKTGTYGLRMEPNATRETVQVAIASATSRTLSFWFRIEVSVAPATQAQTALASVRSTAGTSGGIIMIRVNTDSTVELASGRYGEGTTTERIVSSFVQIDRDTWHLVELLCVSHASAGRIAWRLNGVQQDDSGTTLNTGGGNLVQMNLRCSTTASTANWDFDNWAVRDDTTYPGDHRVILRKVKSGSPTYNAFTKTGGTNASDVWSDIPFDATDNAKSTAADQAQTALVEDAAAGTDAIASADTINGCRVAMVAKKI